MTVRSHGSAYPYQVPEGAHRGVSETQKLPPAYRGCTRLQPRRGTARTGPRAQALLAANCRTIAAAIVLELGPVPYAGVPCWTGTQRWAQWTVPVAYDLRYDTDVRPHMGANQISRRALLRIAEARARYADYATGRDCRPSNERLATDTGYDVRTIQRASTVLRLLGVATEVLRGRQRTRIERLASWRVGDRGRGWASVWALHDHRLLNRVIHKVQSVLSPHPRSGPVRDQHVRQDVVTTRNRRRTGAGNRGAARRARPDGYGLALAKTWRAHPQAPPWCHRHSPTAWAAILAAPAAAGWTPRDLNQLITDWLGVGHWIPDTPHKPIGLLGAILAWHGPENLAERPAALDEAREAQARAANEQLRRAESATSHRAHLAGRAAAQAAQSGPGRAEAFAALAAARQRSAQRRTAQAAAEQARIDALIERARTPRR
ncbi:helix-turn-helix domain-containing protein [Mycobacterium avium]|nr:helix-turn-helix domain-containing protein [Mycobacterium avium subsp. hominissuis]MBZ4575287.1 helix-turn-helix domain-containing protein [Mycobacterium avium subsp. hominissuis]MCA2240521.1 helix-turn-helix domain-containing protein [Mycobacterium avium]MCA2286802.1 helix-turn-helix domain-containing protein [Mycobacterium avium]QNI15377.1 helix-turn-helix domain-containing protein [Mycobacterium kubicae]